MSANWQGELCKAIASLASPERIVALLRQYKAQGVTRDELDALLDAMRVSGPDEATDDRILEVADFVAGFCSPHMKVWEN